MEGHRNMSPVAMYCMFVFCSHVYMSQEQSRHAQSLSTTPVQGTCTTLQRLLPAFTAPLTDTGMICMQSEQQKPGESITPGAYKLF